MLTLKMEPELKAKWLDALRSSEKYVQAQQKMYDGEDEQGRMRMCCLGVLEHLCGTSMKDFITMKEDYDSDTCRFVQLPYDIPSGRKSPEKLLQQSGMFPLIKTGVTRACDLEHHLASMNDNGESFEEIAQFIDETI
jgi:hypothetical protein